MHNGAPVLLKYSPSQQMYFAMRNNFLRVAEVQAFAGANLQGDYMGDGAIVSMLQKAKQTPNTWHVVSDKPRPTKRQVWGRIVQ